LEAPWRAYVKSVRVLLVPDPDDRPLDQYLEMRDRVLGIVESYEFTRDLEVPWNSNLSDDVRAALLSELKALPLAVEVASATAKSDSEKTGWFKRLLGRASTVAGSVKDILANLPPNVKNGLTLLKEVIDIFKG
jgi:hypothetical protein